MKWKQISRKIILDTKFVKVFEDTIELPNGDVIDDYTVIKKPDAVVIIATDESGQLISLQEYKYAVDQVMNTLPAGHIDENENSLEAAKRELREETGYEAEAWEELGTFYDFPSKDSHKSYLVKATNAHKTYNTSHERTESIVVRVIPIEELKKEVKEGKWKANIVLSALVISGIYS